MLRVLYTPSITLRRYYANAFAKNGGLALPTFWYCESFDMKDLSGQVAPRYAMISI